MVIRGRGGVLMREVGVGMNRIGRRLILIRLYRDQTQVSNFMHYFVVNQNSLTLS